MTFVERQTIPTETIFVTEEEGLLHQLLLGGGPGPAWYLRCLIFWKLISMFTCELSQGLQALFALVVGLTAAYQLPSSTMSGLGTGAWLRCFSMYPFFALGQHLDIEHFRRLIGPPGLIRLTCGWLAILLLVLVFGHEYFGPMLDEPLFEIETFPLPFTQYRNFLKPDDFAWKEDHFYIWALYLSDVALRSSMALLFFLFCVPRRETFYSEAGGFVLYPFLLHDGPSGGLSYLLGRFLDFCLDPLRRDLGGLPFLDSFVVQAVRLLACLVLTYALASRPVRLVFSWVIEPSWLMKLRSETMKTFN